MPVTWTPFRIASTRLLSSLPPSLGPPFGSSQPGYSRLSPRHLDPFSDRRSPATLASPPVTWTPFLIVAARLLSSLPPSLGPPQRSSRPGYSHVYTRHLDPLSDRLDPATLASPPVTWTPFLIVAARLLSSLPPSLGPPLRSSRPGYSHVYTRHLDTLSDRLIPPNPGSLPVTSTPSPILYTLRISSLYLRLIQNPSPQSTWQ